VVEDEEKSDEDGDEFDFSLDTSSSEEEIYLNEFKPALTVDPPLSVPKPSLKKEPKNPVQRKSLQTSERSEVLQSARGYLSFNSPSEPYQFKKGRAVYCCWWRIDGGKERTITWTMKIPRNGMSITLVIPLPVPTTSDIIGLEELTHEFISQEEHREQQWTVATPDGVKFSLEEGSFLKLSSNLMFGFRANLVTLENELTF
jgi:hypothetical protein